MDRVLDLANWSLIFWELVTLAVVVVVLLFLVMVVRRLLWSGNGPVTSARRVLDERYARGEIDRDEYERKRRDLRG